LLKIPHFEGIPPFLIHDAAGLLSKLCVNFIYSQQKFIRFAFWGRENVVRMEIWTNYVRFHPQLILHASWSPLVGGLATSVRYGYLFIAQKITRPTAVSRWSRYLGIYMACARATPANYIRHLHASPPSLRSNMWRSNFINSIFWPEKPTSEVFCHFHNYSSGWKLWGEVLTV